MNLKPLKPDQQQKHPTRWSYHQNSKDFIGWVNRLGIERTWAGRLASYLDQRFQLRAIALLFIFALALSFFIYWDIDISYTGYKEGDLATADIKSPISFEVIDIDQTNRKKAEAENAIPPVYDFDVGLYDELIERVKTALRSMRGQLIQNPRGDDANEFMSHQKEFEADLGGVRVSRENFQWLTKQRFRSTIDSVLTQNLRRWGSQKIVEDLGALKQSGRNRIIINILERGFKGDEFLFDTGTLLDTTEVRRRILNQPLNPQGLKPENEAQYKDILQAMVHPNLSLNRQETEIRKLRARESVEPVVVNIKKGQTIVHEGAPLQRIHVLALDELRRLQATRHQDFVALMSAAFFVILLLCYAGYLTRFMSKVFITRKDAFSMAAILLLITALAKFILFVANTALIDRFTNVPPTFYQYLIPFSTGAMMVGLLTPFGEVVWLFSMFLSVIAGLLLDRNFMMMVVTFTSSIVAARGVYGCKKREDLYWAGIKTGLVNAALIFCITLMSRSQGMGLRTEILWNTSAGFLSGLFASFTALTLIPLWESLFVYTTDVKLLELSNLNHPLLKDLIVKAPGTYHHSLIVGHMCESAAEAIGANPLLAKVCAYYHDIGKTHYAQYFIENQRPGENRHDQINPGMSKTILIAHVKDGVEMGLKYKLGKPIIDVIEQHHGTTLISFFYHKAKEHEDTDMHEVSEDEYRYPGPKPQFREAALCMLADSIEAAARSLDEPTPARLQSIVHNIVQKKFLDGQLDECNLTLKDLTVIEEAFAKILLGIYHQRIDYPTGPAKPALPRRSHQTVS
jgi:cyclic-di-AMP phosphodiesterase PgpH